MMHVLLSSVLSWATLKKVVGAADDYKPSQLNEKGDSQRQREAVSTLTRPIGEKLKIERLFHFT